MAPPHASATNPGANAPPGQCTAPRHQLSTSAWRPGPGVQAEHGQCHVVRSVQCNGREAGTCGCCWPRANCRCRGDGNPRLPGPAGHGRSAAAARRAALRPVHVLRSAASATISGRCDAPQPAALLTRRQGHCDASCTWPDASEFSYSRHPNTHSYYLSYVITCIYTMSCHC